MIKQATLILALLGGLGYAALYAATTPSNTRDWTLDQSRLATSELNGKRLLIRNIRNFRYHSATDFIPNWYDREYDLDRLTRVWFIIEPFSDWNGAAHTFLSFEFEATEPEQPNDFLAISVEIRKEQGETFSPLMGLLRQYEIMYVIADERDLIPLRVLHRKDDVYIYPAHMPSQQAMQDLLLGMLKRANRLSKAPEYYNTFTSTCTTNIVRHINELFPGFVPWSHKIIFPGYADELAHELGMIDTDLPFNQAREHYRVNEAVRQYAYNEQFSVFIRQQGGRAR